MFDENDGFVPDFLSEEDRKALGKYTADRLFARYGLGEQVAVVVVDMTRGFVEDQFRTGWAATGIPCANNIRRLLDFVRQHRILVFFTRPSRWLTATERGLWGKGSQPIGEMAGEPEEARDFYPLLEPIPGEIVIEKQKPSAFFGTPFHAMLTYHRVDTLIVTGMVTSGCVRATVNDAFSNNFRSIIPLECVADRSQMSHQIELFDMGVKYADVVRLAQLLAELKLYAAKREPTTQRFRAEAGAPGEASRCSEELPGRNIVSAQAPSFVFGRDAIAEGGATGVKLAAATHWLGPGGSAPLG